MFFRINNKIIQKTYKRLFELIGFDQMTVKASTISTTPSDYLNKNKVIL